METLKDRFAYNIGYGSGSGSDDGSGSGSGYGDGSGDGYGYGYGSGYGSGYGYGYGDGSGDGYGYGYGDGSGIKSFGGYTVYMIDGVQTILKSVHGNTAMGYCLKSDLTLSPCYIVKSNGEFAHGETLKKAVEALREKLFEDMDEDERIEAFISEHKHGAKYSGEHFFEWHHKLTGSCEMGRKAFILNKQLDIKSKYTVDEFIALTQNDYGGETIRQLKEEWET